MRPLSPLDVSGLIAPLHRELIALLRNLDPADWKRPTVAPSWCVHDVVAHLLDGDLRALSSVRDGHLAPPDAPIEGYDDLVGFLNRLNDLWVRTARRLSSRVLVELLAATGNGVAATFEALPPHDKAPFAVAWAGEDESVNWMHVGREYTERWHHQMQVRDAVGAPALFQARWFTPLLEISLRALPHSYRSTEADAGRSITVEISGLDGGAWSLVREDTEWAIYAGRAPSSATLIQLDPDTAWKSLYHAITPDEARERATVSGDEALAAPFFQARSVMV